MSRDGAVARFAGARPSGESHWRALILFGRNVASYKFALGQSLLDLGATERELISLEELAVPFSRNICRHLEVADRQATSPRSRYLEACRAHNAGTLSEDELIETTVRLGFANVIDAFHVLDGTDTSDRFFLDERRTSGGIRITERTHAIATSPVGSTLSVEAESRWSLVEAAWELNLPRSLLTVTYDPSTAQLVPTGRRRRSSITGARGALNGYQKGACFYCFAPVSTVTGQADLAQVDHVFAWSAGPSIGGAPVDGVWNLVLACARCNGWHEKSDRPPHSRYVDRLHRRNEFLIASQHPLRPTLVAQTGGTEAARVTTLRSAHAAVTVGGVRQQWEAPEELDPRF